MQERTPFAHVHMKGMRKQLYQESKREGGSSFLALKGIEFRHNCAQEIIVLSKTTPYGVAFL